MRSIRRCSGRALAVAAVLAVTLGAPIAAISDSAYASGTSTVVAHDDSTPTDPTTDPGTDPASTDPASTDPASTDPGSDTDSPTGTATAQASGQPQPGHPTSVVATQTADQTVVVSWVAPTYVGDSDITGYVITSDPAGHGCPHTLFGSDTSCTITGLTDGAAYTFTVQAYNDHGPDLLGDPTDSNEVRLVGPISSAPEVNAQPDPTIAGRVDVSWSAPQGTSGALSYSVTGDSPCTSNGATSCFATGLSHSRSYTFYVTASNGLFSSPIGSDSATPNTTPGVPTFTTSTAGNGQIRLFWNAPADGGATITAYTVGRNDGSTGCGPRGNPAPTTCLISGLDDGVSYIFDIYATNAYGNGPVSNFSKPILIPPAPVSTPTPQPVVTDPGNPAPSSSSAPPTGDGGATGTGTVDPPRIHHTKLVLGKPTTKKGTTTLAASLTADGITGGVASQRITVLVQDRLRHKSLHTIITDGAGKATITVKAQVITDVELLYAGGPGYTPVTKTTTLVVAAPQGCKVKVRTGFGTTTATGTCTEAHLPRGTRLQLQYLSGKKWIAAASGKSTSTTLKFSLTLNRTGKYQVRVLLAANSVYGATTLTLPTLRVR